MQEFSKFTQKIDQQEIIISSHKDNLKNLDTLTQDHNESIKTLKVDLEKQGTEILDIIKNQNEKMMNDMKEEINVLKTSVVAKIDVVDKKVNDFISHVNFQLKENKILTDDFSLRLKYLDKKMEENDENFVPCSHSGKN